MRELNHPSVDKISKAKAKIPKRKWQTDLNDIDCGVFVLRHMDTFKGGVISKYDPGFLKESKEQKRQLIKLRKKYATKILMCDVNQNQAAVLQEANAFAKLHAAESMKIISDAYDAKE